ncbi:hydrolase [Bowmanella denitrificans]|uniref:Hydrolase n=1 Tax=Bowmanella denitrificans TaxID=366582 RepID=A0ABN0X392_9ALTE
MPTRLSAQNSALVLVDVQGKLARMMPDAESLIHRICVLLQGAVQLDIPILWLEQNPAGLGPTVPEISALLRARRPIAKQHFDACSEPDFARQIAALNRRYLILCGIEAHICVLQTALGLLTQKHAVYIVADAVASKQEAHKQLALQRLTQEGCRLCNVEMLLFEWLASAQHPAFKPLLPLIKSLPRL